MKSKNLIICVLMLVALTVQSQAQQGPSTYLNPILPGYHPDPSICRVGEDYYLATSTFEWYPGMPIYHSKDLVNWELIGHGIHRPSGVEFQEGLRDNGGVFAPTLRHHEGTFYLINTCIGCGGNYYITATEPAGPWSEPVWLDAPGIDPSLFWDDDGRSYYVGHGNLKQEQEWPMQQGVWMQELDLEKGELTGPRRQLTHGHASNAVWAEGPHLYKIDGSYLLLIAEGGTDEFHAVTVFNSDDLWGPYVPNYTNPVLTHRHLGPDYPIWATGHADLVETQNGEWWAVMLAKRKEEGFTLLARETNMVPVKMTLMEQNGNEVLTPVFNPGKGIIEKKMDRPDLPWSPFEAPPARDEFDADALDLEWNFLRTPYTSWYELDKGALELQLRPGVLDSLVNPSFVARRIKDYKFEASTRLGFDPKKEDDRAGIAIYRTSRNHYQLVKQNKEILLIRTASGEAELVAREDFEGKELVLAVEADGLELVFKYGPSEDELQQIGVVQNMNLVSDELAWGFNGSYIGMYATSAGSDSKAKARFDWFEYEGYDRESKMNKKVKKLFGN